MNETLRLFPPGTLAARIVDKPQGLQITPEVHVPKGYVVAAALYSYQRSPRYWPRAQEFLPERWLPVGFGGAGPLGRACRVVGSLQEKGRSSCQSAGGAGGAHSQRGRSSQVHCPMMIKFSQRPLLVCLITAAGECGGAGAHHACSLHTLWRRGTHVCGQQVCSAGGDHHARPPLPAVSVCVEGGLH